MPLPVAGELIRFAALHGQRGNPLDLLAVADTAVIFTPASLLRVAEKIRTREVMVVAAEGMACLKVDMQGFDKEGVEKLCLNTQ